MPVHRHFAFLGCTLLIFIALVNGSEASFSTRSSASSDQDQWVNHQNAILESDSAIMPNGAINETHFPKLNSSSVPAFIIIDVQNCFLPGGAIPVAHGDKVIPIINKIREDFFFRSIVLSQDWHCPNHISFKTQHPGATGPVLLTYNNESTSPLLCDTPGAGIFKPTSKCNITEEDEKLVSFEQVLWPPHCVQGTQGAKFAKNLMVDSADFILRKGIQCQVDSYSAFELNDHLGWTPLTRHLEVLSIDTVFIAGLALDYCVKHTALDARARNLTTFVVLDATKATSDAAIETTVAELIAAGVHVVYSRNLEAIGLRKQYSKLIALAAIIPASIIMIVLLVLLIRTIRKPKPENIDDWSTVTEEDVHKSLLSSPDYDQN